MKTANILHWIDSSAVYWKRLGLPSHYQWRIVETGKRPVNKTTRTIILVNGVLNAEVFLWRNSPSSPISFPSIYLTTGLISKLSRKPACLLKAILRRVLFSVVISSYAHPDPPGTTHMATASIWIRDMQTDEVKGAACVLKQPFLTSARIRGLVGPGPSASTLHSFSAWRWMDVCKACLSQAKMHTAEPRNPMQAESRPKKVED